MQVCALHQTNRILLVVIVPMKVAGCRIHEGLVAMAEKDGDARVSVEACLYGFWTNITGSYWWS